ncbi:hypothetical protein FHT80_006407 [Rhizobium sp. BK226]|nr:hypothetical protein [Rhizobium sp. BK226]
MIGLAGGICVSDLEKLTINAIRVHRQLVEKADQLFQLLPHDYKAETATGDEQHLEYSEAMIEMHAQMSEVNRLVGIFGYIPRLSIN